MYNKMLSTIEHLKSHNTQFSSLAIAMALSTYHLNNGTIHSTKLIYEYITRVFHVFTTYFTFYFQFTISYSYS